MARFDDVVRLRAVRQQPVAEARHGHRQRQEEGAAHAVVENVEGDHQLGVGDRPGIDPVGQRPHQRQHQGAAGQLEQQAAQGHPAPGGVLQAAAEQREDAAAEVGADHQAERHLEGNHLGRGEGRGEQHGGQAGVGNHGEQGAGQGIQQHVASEGGEQHLHPLGGGDGFGGGDYQLQREDDQPEADAHAAELAEAGLLAGEKEDHAEEDQQRRQPGQVQGQHPCHQRRADVRAEHDGERRGQQHQPLGDEGADQQRRGIAALHQGGHADTGGEGQRPATHAAAEQAAQVGAVHAEDPRSHDVRAPDEQGDGREQIEQRQHGGPPGDLEGRCVHARGNSGAVRRVVTKLSSLDLHGLA
ncbi:hypothetical protein D3C76_940210 [compost metagenome]